MIKALHNHPGSCHCGAVKFTVSGEVTELTTCDCSLCRRRATRMIKVHESGLRLLEGQGNLSEYQFHTHTATHYFCRTCGIYPFHRKRVTPDYYGININCLEDEDFEGVPVRETSGSLME